MPKVFPVDSGDDWELLLWKSSLMSAKLILFWTGGDITTVSLMTLFMSSLMVAPLSSFAKWDITNSIINQTKRSIALMKTCNRKSRLYFTWIKSTIKKLVAVRSRFFTNLVIVTKSLVYLNPTKRHLYAVESYRYATKWCSWWLYGFRSYTVCWLWLFERKSWKTILMS